ncbi:MAG: hypothetical protein IJU76_05015 [Desulfovibrionaceae bacterium]|nr:hypothetical protein [Desulfovibrionaceae bacterium]
MATIHRNAISKLRQEREDERKEFVKMQSTLCFEKKLWATGNTEEMVFKELQFYDFNVHCELNLLMLDLETHKTFRQLFFETTVAEEQRDEGFDEEVGSLLDGVEDVEELKDCEETPKDNGLERPTYDTLNTSDKQQGTDENTIRITPEKEKFLMALRATHMSLYQIKSIRDNTMVIRDLVNLRKMPQTIYAGLAADRCKAGDIVGLRLINFNNSLRCTNGIITFPRELWLRVAGAITYTLMVNKAYEYDTEICKLTTDETLKYLFKYYNFKYTKEEIEDDGQEELFSFSQGSLKSLDRCPVVITRYTCRDKKQFRRDLNKIKDLYQVDKSTWDYDTKGQKSPILAHIAILKNQILTATLSNAHAQYVQKILEEKTSATYKDSYTDTLDSICKMEEENGLCFTGPVTLFTLTAAMTALLEETWQTIWPDFPTYLLDVPPRRAAKKINEVQHVHAILKDLEANEKKRAKCVGFKPANFEPVWKELGLKR